MSKVILILIPLLVGCASTKEAQPTVDEIIPNEIELHNLLHIGGNIAYKSITKEDYEIKENC